MYIGGASCHVAFHFGQLSQWLTLKLLEIIYLIGKILWLSESSRWNNQLHSLHISLLTRVYIHIFRCISYWNMEKADTLVYCHHVLNISKDGFCRAGEISKETTIYMATFPTGYPGPTFYSLRRPCDSICWVRFQVMSLGLLGVKIPSGGNDPICWSGLKPPPKSNQFHTHVLNYLDFLRVWLLGPQWSWLKTVGGRRGSISSNDRSFRECVWDSQCSGLRWMTTRWTCHLKNQNAGARILSPVECQWNNIPFIFKKLPL